jgi:hypothetical protein
VTTTTFLGVGAGLGVASGTLLAMIGRTVPGDRAGLITGVVGAAGGLGGFVPPIVLAVVEELDGSYALGLMILADVVLAAALHLRAHREWIGDALVYPAAHPAPTRLEETATTVVALSAADAAEAEPALLGTLADLAVRHELVIAYGHTDDKADQLSPQALLEALRARLPRYRVTAVYVDPVPRLGPAECELIEEMLNEGTLAVAVMPAADAGPTAEALAVRLGADNAMRLDYDPAHGARLREITRPEAAIPG